MYVNIYIYKYVSYIYTYTYASNLVEVSRGVARLRHVLLVLGSVPVVECGVWLAG